MAFIQVTELTKKYSKKSAEVTALDNISFEINESDFISIVGRSGSGKSTFLNLIGGLDTPTSGDILINGKSLNSMNKKEQSDYRKFSVGMIFQSFNLIPYKSALENVKLPMVFSEIPKKERNEIAVKKLTEVGLQDRIHHIPAEMSGGEAQRVAIARALTNKPGIILADEPTGNLDSATAEQIINILKNLNKSGITIIMITHEKDIAHSASDRIITLKDGKIESIEIQNSAEANQ